MGWNNSNVSFAFTTADSLSGVASTSIPSPLVLSAEGTSVAGNVTVTDVAGNTASFNSPPVKIEKTLPTAQAAASPQPNGAGWNNGDVTVSFTGSNALSGIASCSPPVVISTEGKNQSASGTCIDNAGNVSQPASVSNINIDKTPPVVTITSPANGATVNPPSLTVSGTATDLLSGVASVSCQGAAATLSGSNFSCVVPIVAGPNSIVVQAIDAAGNMAQATVSVQGGIPVILSVSPNTGNPGQQNLSVSILAQYTHFTQATSTVSFGADITVSAVTVNSPVSLTAVLNIAASAVGSTRNVTVKTGNEIVSSANAFSVATNQPPTVTAGSNQNPFTEFSLPTPGNFPWGITNGPDGNLWFAESGLGDNVSSSTGNKIGKITPAGVITEYPLPIGNTYRTCGRCPIEITAGPDGNLWFTEYGPGKIGRMTPSGVLTEFPIPTGNSFPYGIAAGPDGALWFTETGVSDGGVGPIGGNNIGRITTDGVITEFPIPTARSDPREIVKGPDGNLWFTEEDANKIGRITTAGVITEYSVPFGNGCLAAPYQCAFSITTGPDGNLWFADYLEGNIGKITPGGAITQYPIPASFGIGSTLGITSGPDGNVWFAYGRGPTDQIVKITTDGAFTSYPVPSAGAGVFGIVTGPDGNLWFAENLGNRIGRFSLSAGTATLNGTVTDDGLPVGASLGTTWSVVTGPGPVTFSNPTATFPDVAGQINPVATSATFTTSGTYTIRLTANDSQLTSSADVTITVNPPPSITQVTPNSGQQGQQNLSVTITGGFTHFVQGNTTASFGAGITVASLTINSPTSAAAVLNIDPAAVTGPRNVTLTTNGEVASLENGFNVTPGTQILLSVTPNTGQQGQKNLSVAINGQYTHWVQGTTTASFGGGITVVSLTINSPASATSVLNIDMTAIAGPRDVTLTTGTESVMLSSGFTVSSANQPPVVSVGGNQTISLPNPAMLTGSFSDDGLPIGATLTANWSKVNGPVSTGGQTWIKLAPPGALPVGRSETGGAYDPTTNRLLLFGGSGFNFFSNDSWLLTNANGLTGTPQWVQLSPSGSSSPPRAGYAHTYDPGSNRFVIFGGYNATGLLNDVWVLTNANGIGGQSQWLPITAGGTAPSARRYLSGVYDPGTNRLMIFGGMGLGNGFLNDVWVLTNANGTEPSQPTWVQLSPAGQIPPSRPIYGLGYDPGSNRLILFGGGDSTQINNFFSDVWVLTNANGIGGTPTWIDVIPNNAAGAPSPRALSTFGYNPAKNRLVISGGFGNCTGFNGCVGFHDVWLLNNANGLGGPATWQQLSPTGGSPSTVGQATGYDAADDRLIQFGGGGTYTTPFEVLNNDSWLLTNATNTDPGNVPGTVTFNPPSFADSDVSGTVYSANSSASFSLPGTYVLRLTASDGVLSSSADTTITVNASGTPTITLLKPNSGQQGQQSLSVQISGQFTNFVKGSTTASFGAGITVASLTINSATGATAVLNIDPTTATGTRNVTVTTGAEVATLTNGFTVTPGTPVLISANPSTGQQGQILLVSITGQFTSFQQGTTLASFGDGISVGGGPLGGFGPVTVVSSTQATAQININICALPGARGVTLKTGAESATLPNGFSIVTATNWSVLSPTGTRPSSRLGFTTLYDNSTDRLIVFGGGGSGPDISTEVWVLANASGLQGTPFWTELNPAGAAPAARRNHGAAYDSVNNRMIIFGGDTSTGGASIPVVNDVWVLTNANGLGGTPTWVQLLPQGPAPTGRRLAVTSYDPVTNRLTVFGGWTNTLVSVNDVWVLSNANGLGGAPIWTPLLPTGQLPSPRNGSFFAFDAVHNRLIVFGGESSQNPTSTTVFNDVWLLSGANGFDGPPTWTQLIPNGAIGSPSGRVVNGSSAAPYNIGNNRFMIVGGGIPVGTSDAGSTDVWMLLNANGLGNPASWINLANQPAPVLVGGVSAYDSADDRVILFGWNTSNDTFVLTNATNLPIQNPTPQLLSVVPNSATTGQTLSATLTGACTSFVQGATQVSFGSDIALNGIKVANATSLTANIAIDPAAAPGSRTVTAATGAEVASLPNGFTVTGAAPLVSAGADQTINLPVTDGFEGAYLSPYWTAFGPGTATLTNSVAHSGNQSLLLTISPAYPFYTQLRHDFVSQQFGSVSVWVKSGVVCCGSGAALAVANNGGPNDLSFGIIERTPSGGFLIRFIPPGSGEQDIPINTPNPADWHQLEIVSSSTGLSFKFDGSVVFTSPLVLGFRYVWLSAWAGSGGSEYFDDFSTNIADTQLTGTVTDAQPTGSTISTSWSVDTGPGIVSFGNSTTTFPNVVGQTNVVTTAAGFSSPGVYTLVLTATDSQSSSNSKVTIAVNPPGIGLLSVNPDTGAQGQQNLSVSLTGLNTHFVQGSTSVSFGSDVLVNSVTVATATSLTVVITVPSTATLGAHTVTAMTGSEIASLSNGFTVTATVTPPSITSISPNVVQQGQSGPLSIVGQNTHFVQGTTQVNLGPGITVTNVTVTCATCLTAQGSIADTAPTGAHDVTVTTGTEVAVLPGGFTVQLSPPIILSFGPTSAQQGQSVPISVTGRFTHFVQGTTQVSLGAGVTISNIVVSSSTALTAQAAVDPAATTGTRTLTVTTGTEVASVQSVFTVQPATPTLLSIAPNSGNQGQQNLSLTITGQATHFVQGTTAVSLGGDITINNVTVTNSTSLTVSVSIASSAATGPRTVTVTTGSEVVSLTNGFTVGGGPFLSTIAPGGASQGATNLAVQITGLSTHFVQGTSVASFGAGITVLSLAVMSPTTATATVNIDVAAALGPRTVTVTTNTEVASAAGGFTVIPGVSGITEINPGGGPQGAQGLSVAVTAQFTHFAQGTTTANFGSGVTVASLTINSPLTATAIVNVDAAASVGPRDVTFTTGTEVVTAPGGFTVSLGSPALVSATPNSGQQGQVNLNIQVVGQFTHFAQGTSQANFGAGITINSVTVTNATNLTANVSINANAASGARTVTVTSGPEVVSLPNGFTVTTPAPVLVNITPNTGPQGQQNLSISITGQNTHFAQGATQVGLGADITVTSVSVASATSLMAQINISPTAALTLRTVTVVTGTEQVSLASAFTVQPAPSLSVSTTPSSSLQGQTLAVAITGFNTHFVQGTSQARFGPGIMVGSSIAGDFGPVTVTSPTSATAQITILTSALAGSRTVTVQTGTEQALSSNGFTVIGLPQLVSVSPNAGQQSQMGTVIITGVFTNFLQGTSQATFGPDISVGGAAAGAFGPITVTSPTSATGTVSISATAAPGLRTPVVQTGSEQASLVNGFSVLGPVTGPAPIVNITSPTEASDLSAPTAVAGTVTSPNLDYWILEYKATSDSVFTQFGSGTTATVSGTFDPTMLLNGTAQIRLTGVDTSGQTTMAVVDVNVIKNLKVGNFTVSFNDLTVPVAGIPIQVVRTYDSRNHQAGDFGIGWTLDLKTIRLTTNGPLGNNWFEDRNGGVLNRVFSIQPTSPHVVTVALTDGTTWEFQPVLTPSVQQFQPITQVTVTFAPTGITPPNAALTIVGDNQPIIQDAIPGPITLFDQTNLQTLDPDQYQLTLPDGRVALISRQVGLQSLTDLNGNKLTVTSSGITHSSGKGVTFLRDAQNRITQIKDSAGNTLLYGYNTSGDLVSFTNQTNDVSTYTYNSTHGLLTIRDPSGNQPIRNDYDASGRLVSHTDAFGNVINYTHDLNARQEIVTDRRGNITVNEYDTDGNIVKVTDALGGITNRTYDSRGNVLSETNALQFTRTYTYDSANNRLTETDPLLNTTTYTYNARNQVLTITDPLNNVTTNTYDANGNLTSVKDGAGKITSYTYNAAGLRTKTIDPTNATTNYQYDASGNLTQQTDALSHTTTYTYDGNGNRLTETKTRTTSSGLETLVTSYQYDAQNRLTKTTYPDGSTTQIAYNNIGKQSLTTDQRNGQTTYQYDLMGRLLQTTYPDSTTESTTYDEEGDRLTSTDRATRTTTFVYDPLRRLTETVYADSSATFTSYDGVGQVSAVKDALGNVTQYKYDAAGRRTTVTDPDNHVTTFGYDNDGNQTSMKDANGNTTQYQYDSMNRRTAVIYPDNTTDTTAYDALGRTISKTDQAGKTTQFQYDALGRLIQVTDALNQITQYGYDEVGNRTLQTDANNHTTTFGYDELGRRTKRTLPVGMSETYAYDAAGNQTSKTDFNGKTTTYTYDSVNRLHTKVPDASFLAPTVSITYTTTGQRQLMIDATGTTSYFYDLRDRLISKARPEGTLSYTYDPAGNLISIQSSNTNGASVSYAYDHLNRLSTATDTRTGGGTTTYSYDAVGNLAGYTYPNGVQSTYTYSTLNRLTNVTISHGGALASYAYTLGAAGNRLSVAELGGRTVSYGYDSLYRLTSETIAGGTTNGAVVYTYDPVGNRLSRASTLPAVPPTSYAYDANDRLTTDTYDTEGNTTGSGGNIYTYDFENHLTSSNGGAVTILYDGDGNRVSKTAGGITTKYLVDDRNLTGYVQVLEEIVGGVVQRVYTYGLSRISQSQASGTTFYGYDGHGDVRILTGASAALTDRYDYDAFGGIISQTGNTPNLYFYGGEQLDANLGFYNLRARYYAAQSGRFLTGDVVEGDIFDPSSLHRYLYTGNDPTNKHDPAGAEYTLLDVTLANAIRNTLANVEATVGFKVLDIVKAKVTGAKVQIFSVFDLLPLVPYLFRLPLPLPPPVNPAIGGPLVRYTDEIAGEFNYIFNGALTETVQLQSDSRLTVWLDAIRLKHILNAHTYEFFYVPGARSLNTGWPIGTSPTEILQLLATGLKSPTLKIGDNIVNVGAFTAMLPIGQNGEILTFYPLSGPGIINNIRDLFP
jgi:RHS repeat-associated protein